MDAIRILGVDFTSAPRKAKPITVAFGTLRDATLQVDRIEAFADFAGFDALLARPGPWVGGFDLPFGLPRALVDVLGWPGARTRGRDAWARLMRHLESMPRAEMVAAFRAWCDARPPGSKFAHRATDLRAGSSPSMKWVNPPVAYMLQAGAPRLLAAGLTVPGMHAGDPSRVALEAYPGLVARSIVGRTSYKSDTREGRTPARAQARAAIVEAIERGDALAIRVSMPASLREACLDDPRADLLDAVLCALQAAAAARAPDGYGLPLDLDPVEGWIIGC
ncbi:MAG: hypothetical protein RIS35_2779 [Pseudomonadota bacterium]|jgi:hypothetical protein